MGPDYRRPDILMPDLSAKEEIAEFVAEKWWGVFADSTLNYLEELALKHNADLKTAVANIAEVRAASEVSEAEHWPTVSLSGEGMAAFVSTRGKAYVPGGSKGRNSIGYAASVPMIYEVDFFGKYSRGDEAARAVLLSTRAAKECVLLSVSAEVAKAYFLLRALEAKLAIARRTLNTRQESLRMYKSRFLNGYCTELDYLRIDSDMLSVKATVANLESELAKAETSLSLLIGTNPREMVQRTTAKEKAIEKLRIPPAAPKGIPSDILMRRPDVLQAECQLIAANARIGEARAAYFPTISLTGGFGFESNSLGQLFNTGSDGWSFGYGLHLPIFNAGRIAAMNAAVDARHKKMLTAYEKTIQMAFKETLDALVANRKNREIVAARSRQVNALKRGYQIAWKQKESGLIGLLDLLDVERGLLAAEMELTMALQMQLNATVDLCKALGGGWNALKMNKPPSKSKKAM
jgi:multidrug efflux system outer membrane protein